MPGNAPTLAATLLVSASLLTWSTVLVGVGDSSVIGTAVVEAVGADSLRASVKISGAEANSEHPWMVHRGQCGSNGTVYGDAKQYPSIRVGAEGKGEATAVLAEPAPADGDYSVHVHKSATDLSVIACGTLKPSGPADMPPDTLTKQPMTPQP